MRLLIEGHPYPNTSKISETIEGLDSARTKGGKVVVNSVGYYYNPKIRDVVFILPKVVVDDSGKAFGRTSPEEIVSLEKGKLGDKELKILYEFSVWIHRAIVVFNDSHPDNTIVESLNIEEAGQAGTRKQANTLLDIIISLLRFNRENRSYITFVVKNIHSGHNRINWTRTIAQSAAMVQEQAPVYIDPVNKKRQINFDEELMVIYFSILQHISDCYGFRVEIPFGFKLIRGTRFESYLSGYGRRRLRQIKYKYFSDTALRLWDLCYAFFDKSYLLRINANRCEYLLARNFNIVFEAIIDELIGDKDLPSGLKEQDDNKRVDHLYVYDALLTNRGADSEIFYIGDSKYYTIGHEPGRESVYKQYTYARNVIQWSVDPDRKKDKDDRFGKIRLRDELTEGYNVVPNFFISAKIDPARLDDTDRTSLHSGQPRISRQFENRLFDRDTLIVSHFDVNFLFAVSLYARNNAAEKRSWKSGIHTRLRTAIQALLGLHFDLYAMEARPGVDAANYFKDNFRQTLVKVCRPFENKDIFALALDKNPKYKAENRKLFSQLQERFHIIRCKFGEDPSDDTGNFHQRAIEQTQNPYIP